MFLLEHEAEITLFTFWAPRGGGGVRFLRSNLNLQLANEWAEGASSLRRNGIRRQARFFGVHFYILRALRVIQRNWRAIKMRLGQTSEKRGLTLTVANSAK